MALPVVISGVNMPGTRHYIGPYISSAGNVYGIFRDSTNTAQLRAEKATDPTSSFAEVDSSNRPVFGTAAVWALKTRQVGSIIHVAGIETTDNQVWYAAFDTADDTWRDVDGSGNTEVNAASPSPGAAGGSIGLEVLGSGRIRIFYRGDDHKDMGTNYRSVYETHSDDGGNNWSTPVQVDKNTAADVDIGEAVLPPNVSDQIYLYMQDTTNQTLDVRGMASDNTLRTVRAPGIDGFQSSNPYQIGHGFGLTRSGQSQCRVCRINNTQKLTVYRHRAYSDDTDFTTDDALDQVDGNNSTPASGIIDCIAYDSANDIIHSARRENTDNDLYLGEEDGSDSWTEEATAFRTGTFNFISCNVYVRAGNIRFALFYWETLSGYKYDEDDLGAAGSFADMYATFSGALTGSSRFNTLTNIYGSMVGSLTTAGYLNLQTGLYGDFSSILTNSGILGTLNDINANFVSQLTNSAELGRSIGFYGDLTSSLTNDGFIGILKDFNGQLNSALINNGYLNLQTGLYGALQAQGSNSAYLGAFIGAYGSFSGVLTNAGLIGVQYDIRGTFAGLLTGDATLGAQYDIDGSFAGQLTNDASLGITIALRGDFSSQLTNSGYLNLQTGFWGNLSSQLSNAGNLQNFAGMYGVFQGQGSNQAYINLQTGFYGNFLGALTNLGELEPTIGGPTFTDMDAALLGQLSVAGRLNTLTGVYGTFTSTLTNDAYLSLLIGLNGDFSGVSTFDGLLGALSGISGTLQSQMTSVGELSRSISLYGDLQGQLTNDGLIGVLKDLDGSFSSTFDINGYMNCIVGMFGDLQSQSTFDGAVGSIIGLRGTIQGQGTFEGYMGVLIGLDGTISASANIIGELGVIVSIHGSFNSVSEFLAELQEASFVTGDPSHLTVEDLELYGVSVNTIETGGATTDEWP